MSATLPPGASTRTITAAPQDAGQRVDRFLAANLPELSRSRVKSLVEAGQLLRDGATVSEPAEPVRPGARYALTLPAAVPATPVAQKIPLAILHEDADLIVLDKPAGLVVHPAPGNQDGTLVNALLAHCGDTLPGIGGERRPGIVHRLDRDTSGVMVVAKSELALARLSAAFAARDLDRAYLALVWGLPNPLHGTIQGAIGRDPRDRKRMTVLASGGKPARTSYRVLHHRETSCALLECQLSTGRTHQIRVHLAHSGHPVIGDPVYLRRIPAASRTLLPEAARHAALDFPRQALHAARLGFVHPRTGEKLSFATSPPADMQGLLSLLDVPADAIRTSAVLFP